MEVISEYKYQNYQSYLEIMGFELMQNVYQSVKKMFIQHLDKKPGKKRKRKRFYYLDNTIA